MPFYTIVSLRFRLRLANIKEIARQVRLLAVRVLVLLLVVIQEVQRAQGSDRGAAAGAAVCCTRRLPTQGVCGCHRRARGLRDAAASSSHAARAAAGHWAAGNAVEQQDSRALTDGGAGRSGCLVKAGPTSSRH